MIDPAAEEQVRRIIGLVDELARRLADAEYHSSLRPGNPDGPVSGSRSEPDAQVFDRATQPAPAVGHYRRLQRNTRDRLRRMAEKLEEDLGYRSPRQGRYDHRGRVAIQSVGPDGIRQVG